MSGESVSACKQHIAGQDPVELSGPTYSPSDPHEHLPRGGDGERGTGVARRHTIGCCCTRQDQDLRRCAPKVQDIETTLFAKRFCLPKEPVNLFPVLLHARCRVPPSAPECQRARRTFWSSASASCRVVLELRLRRNSPRAKTCR